MPLMRLQIKRLSSDGGYISVMRCRLRPDGIVATGFMPGISVGGAPIAGSTRSLRIKWGRALVEPMFEKKRN